MRVLYNTCFADPWIKVAQKLKEEQGFDPVYWIGYEDDHSKTLVPEAFPDCIYQDYFDAFKGIFPPQITKHSGETYINIDFIKDYASFELQAIKMMDRMDPDQHSFNFMERQRHYRNMIRYCAACLKYLKIDVVICDLIPHRVFDYVMYLLCGVYKIRYVTFRATAFPGRIIPLTEITSIGNLPDSDYGGVYHSSVETHILKENLDTDLLEGYEKVQKDYSVAEPYYMKQHISLHKKGSGFFPLVKKFFLDMMDQYRYRYFGKDGFLLNGIPTYHKQRYKSIENSHSSLLRYSIRKLKANAFKNKLKKHYNSLVTEPDFTVPYVIFLLHYQPEMTTNPCGDIFVDQRLCIEVLAKQIPSNYLIYVKEHRSQFYAHGEGHTSRIPEFYDDLLSFPQVRLLPLNTDPFLLIKNSIAIATVTGTSGWEGMVLGKPVIIFGLSWYEKYAGVLKIVDEKSAEKIRDFIETYKFDERDLLSYLHAISKKSFLAYAERDIKPTVNQSEDECVSNIANSVTETVKNVKF